MTVTKIKTWVCPLCYETLEPDWRKCKRTFVSEFKGVKYFMLCDGEIVTWGIPAHGGSGIANCKKAAEEMVKHEIEHHWNTQSHPAEVERLFDWVEFKMPERKPEGVEELVWLALNYLDVKARYPGHWIAVKGEQVVLASPSIIDLLDSVIAFHIDAPIITKIQEGPPVWSTAYAEVGLNRETQKPSHHLRTAASLCVSSKMEDADMMDIIDRLASIFERRGM